MPPTRTIPPAKAVKTERTHEENQERCVFSRSYRETELTQEIEHILQLLEEAIEVSKLGLSPRDGHRKFINDEPEDHCE